MCFEIVLLFCAVRCIDNVQGAGKYGRVIEFHVENFMLKGIVHLWEYYTLYIYNGGLVTQIQYLVLGLLFK